MFEAAFKSDSIFMNDTRFGLALCGVLGAWLPLAASVYTLSFSSSSAAGGGVQLLSASCCTSSAGAGTSSGGSESGLVAAGVVLAEDGGVGSDGVTSRSGLTDRQVRAIVSWLRFANTFATRKRAVEELPPPWPPSSLFCVLCGSLLTLIVCTVSAARKAVWLVLGEKGGVGPL